jgi:GT2 family glycosyltransferase
MADVGAVIVTHNSAEVIGACLNSCRAAGLRRIVVVDNASTDGTRDAVRESEGVLLAENADNRGFAAGVNQGAKLLESGTLLILNPDARLLTGLGPLEDAAEKFGAACGLLVDDSGRPQRGFTHRSLPSPAALAAEILGINRIWPRNPVNRRYRCLDERLDIARDVEQPAGAFFAVRRDVWERLGGFDERFHPVWFEDVDFCRRLALGGYRIRYVPEVKAAHLGGHSVRRIPGEHKSAYWYGSLLTYAAKHFHHVWLRLLGLAVVLSAFPRLLAGIPRDGWRASITAGAAVVRVAGRFVVLGVSASRGDAPAAEPTPRLLKQSSSTGS